MTTIINGMGRVGIRPTSVPTTPAIWNNLTAYYSADNTSDDAKGTNNGTLVNGTTYATGKINNGFSFDGINDYISISPIITTNIKGNAHTYTAWIKANTLGGYKWIIQCSGADKGTSMCMNGNKVSFFYKGLSKVVSSSTNILTGSWYHVAITYDGLNTCKFYVNGSAGGSADVSSWLESGSVNVTNIGSMNGGSNFFNGIIDEVGIWGRELSITEISQLYNSGTGKQYPN